MVETPEAQLYADDETLRIALLVDDFVQPNWVCKIIEEINQSKTAKIGLVILGRPGTSRLPAASGNIVNRRRHLTWLLYQKVDRLLFNSTPSALETSDISPLVATCRKCSIDFNEDHANNRSEDKFEQEINSSKLDVVLCFGIAVQQARLTIKTRYGIWFYEAGDNIKYRGEPSCFWETFDNNPTVSIRLEALDVESGQTKTLDQCWRGTDPISVTRSQNELYWGVAGMTGKVLNQLHSQGLSALQKRSRDNRCETCSEPRDEPPTNRELVPFLGRLAWRMAGRQATNRLYEGQWCLAYETELSPSDAGPVYDMKCLIPPGDRFWADPFPIEEKGAYFVFIEEYLFRSGKAHISVIEMDNQGAWKDPVKVLEKPYHLSYPFVFKWDGAYYMIPETQAAESIQLYKCMEFPRRWELERVLIQGVCAVDTTLLRHDGKWWMFTSIKNREEINNTSNLCLFFADGPLGPWHPHIKNSIVSDARSGRSGGCLFSMDGELYRPAQDCSQSYGGAMSIRRITRLDCSEYREEETGRLEPARGTNLLGVHTYNQAGNLTVVDFLRLKSKLQWTRDREVLRFARPERPRAFLSGEVSYVKERKGDPSYYVPEVRCI